MRSAPGSIVTGDGEVGEEPLVNLVAGTRRADVDDVVIELHVLVGRDVRHFDVDWVEESRLGLLFLSSRDETDRSGDRDRGDESGSHENSRRSAEELFGGANHTRITEGASFATAENGSQKT